MQADNSSRLDKIAKHAHQIHNHLSTHAALQAGMVHFRPASNGITMVSLHAERPQRGKSGYQAERLSANFEAEFSKYCVEIEQGRPTPEKRLQSYLIANAYRNGRHMQALQACLAPTEDTALYFVTDEIALWSEDKRVVCDLLAINQRPDGIAPVLIELKSERHMTRLVEQLDSYTALLWHHRANFEQIFSALLGREIRFKFPPEKWLVWPSALETADRREAELLLKGIRVVGYREAPEGFTFAVGRHPD